MKLTLVRICLFSLLICSNSAYSQTWQSLTSGKSTFFVIESSDTLIWNYTTRFDTLINGDSVYKLPAYYDICRGCNMCNISYNQFFIDTDTFLIGGKTVLTSGNDWLLSERNLLLKNNNILHQSWLADTAFNITAEVDTIVTLNVLGITDSVRVYRFNTGDSLLIGKHFGLISFPTWYNSGKYLHLTGSREDQLGNYLPSHYTLNNWQHGDVFYYEGFAYSCVGPNPCPCTKTKTRFDVLTRTDYPDSITYQVKKTHFTGQFPSCYPGGVHTSGYTQQTTYNKTIQKYSHFGDVWLNDASINISPYTVPVGPPFVIRCSGFEYAGIKGVTYNPDVYNLGDFTLLGNTYEAESDMFKMVCTQNIYHISPFHYNILFSYLEGIGTAKDRYSTWDLGSEYELKGFIKNGVTEGTVISAENLLLLSAESHTLTDINIYYSNGAVYADGIPADAFPVQFTISDMSGKILYKKEVNTSGHVFDLNGLPAGLYLIDGHSDQYVIPAQKMQIGM